MTKSSSFFLELLAKGVKDLSAEFESNLTQQCELELAAEERVNGKLTQAARDARQALNNPNLMTTHHARHLTAARKTMLSAKKAEASALSQAVVAMINAAQATDYLQECEKASAKIEPRKRPTPAVGVDPEEMVLINELRKRGVTASKCDQLNDENLDYLANLINDKVKAPRHADIGDSWGRAFSAGHLEIPVECASADQKLAMNIAMNPDRQDAAITYDDLCRLAKKKLDISHDFALNLCKELNEREWFNGAYAENIVRAFHEQRDKDIDITLEVLGISPESYKRANQVVDSKYSNLLFSRFHARKIADEQQSNNMKNLIETEINKFHPLATKMLNEKHTSELEKYYNFRLPFDDTILTKSELLGFLYKSVREYESGDGFDDYMAAARAVEAGTYQSYMTRKHPVEIKKLAEQLYRSTWARKEATYNGYVMPPGYEVDTSDMDDPNSLYSEYNRALEFATEEGAVSDAADTFAEFCDIESLDADERRETVSANQLVVTSANAAQTHSTETRSSPMCGTQSAVARQNLKDFLDED